MPDLPAEAEEALTNMTAGEFAALTARLRAPDTTEQLRSHAAKILSGPQLDAFIAAANPAAFVSDAGGVDEEKVVGHLTALLMPGQSPQPGHQWGQSSASPAGGRAGDAGRQALRRRHQVGGTDNEPGAGSQAARGSSAKAELAKRYGNPGGRK